ncbi:MULTISPECIES: D-alanyl-D-alanine carboxypeptidase/D-alanyl-D-alanine endopeptidase [Corynebacterium]|uniref:D-alanyl-D-alanine carboxypeptidase/D-alanyl-D-alanine endopeptidase n=1 Tax=Corynebacterium TaxID=1716 RepID=UPI0021AEAA9B|nr:MULTISPECIES: D-alanyl-D-alanine carboxypeptidase/D-alanyl-D-alanine-endopeptidase [Corynebacterium]MCT1585068.1 D-alanyl-D-alanine carboxypeptidase/D-alanyl-D-alanine-endopeptidase [Corynebacterium sanguinis]MCT2023109.1 D-alanyl-D-alanine carboxypeptidase/D-alanyl-D-alanine-endopeptidase [Corynebacterium sanguinis]WNI12968.1 D-alanyl-D-alanine carboxypeptidase/D-alanyl-D-alanine-endopeptidase [Corynebacterium sp. Z-1]
MKVWTSVMAAVALAAVGGVAGFGVVAQRELAELTVAPAYALPAATPVLEPATPQPVDTAARAAEVAALAADEALGTFHARITDAATGETVFESAPNDALRPASSTKLLTGSAAIVELGATDTITTEVVRGLNPGEVVIKAAGDVWMNQESIDSLAEQIGSADTVLIDTSLWTGETMLPGWNPVDIDAGFIAPLEPAMLNGGRGFGAESGDVPRSHTPAIDVAQALADSVGAATVGPGTAPAGAEVVATTTSPDLVARLRAMMKDSDNVMAEAIGREVAIHRGSTAPQATLDVLAEHGFTTAGTTLADSSGLSTLNLITPALLDAVLLSAAQGGEIAPLLDTLPVAHGEGTLYDRFEDLPGRGWVRAKTGTLDYTSALVGTVTSENGNVYTFALLSNDSEILPARRAMDTLTSALRKY